MVNPPGVFKPDARRDRPPPRFNVLASVLVACAAGLAYVVAVTVRTVPDPETATPLFTAAPLLCLIAMLVYQSVAREEFDLPLRWAAAGLTICFAALTLQFISFPIVSADGGWLGTNAQSSAALYLTFHAALYLGAAIGVTNGSSRWLIPFTVIGCLLPLALALNLVPLPELIDEQVLFTPVLTGIEIVLAGLGLLVAALWSVRSGRTPTPLVGWFGFALVLSVADLALNAATAERYDPVWWASLSMRVATFAVLALGGVWFVLGDRRRLQRYTEAELSRREFQLTLSGRATESLVANAVTLSRASTPGEVGASLTASISEVTGCPRVLVFETVHDPTSGLRLLGHRGYDEQSLVAAQEMSADPTSPAGFLHAGGDSLYLVGREQLFTRLPAIDKIPAQRREQRIAGIRMEVTGRLTGVVVVSDDLNQPWTDADQGVLAALVAQGGPALARARQHATEHHNAEVLQRSLLPAGLPDTPGLAIAARYVPGDPRAQVGGDWYDVDRLEDGRVLLTVGDVMGKGIRAAATMGALRQSVRVLSRVDPSPSALLDRLESAAADLGEGVYCTLLLMLWDPSNQTLTFCRAGHLPPLLVTTRDGARRLEGALSPPMGTSSYMRPQEVVQFTRGDHLLLYTDGLVEYRGEDIDEGIDRVTATVQASVVAGSDLDDLANELITLGAHDDDVALLVIRAT